MSGFWNALAFLTTLPSPFARSQERVELSKAVFWFPLVGGIIGGALCAAYLGLERVFAPPLAGAFLLGLWVLFNGGLHLDGLADCCDGMAVSASPERRLEIMRDPRLGTFGGTGLVLYLLTKYLALLALPRETFWFGLLFAPMLARWVLLLMAKQPGQTGGHGGRLLCRGQRARHVAFGPVSTGAGSRGQRSGFYAHPAVGVRGSVCHLAGTPPPGRLHWRCPGNDR